MKQDFETKTLSREIFLHKKDFLKVLAQVPFSLLQCSKRRSKKLRKVCDRIFLIHGLLAIFLVWNGSFLAVLATFITPVLGVECGEIFDNGPGALFFQVEGIVPFSHSDVSHFAPVFAPAVSD